MNTEFWNSRYSETPAAYGIEPNQYLVQQSFLFRPGMKILSVGEGEGRNAIWLAERQIDIWGVDYSKEGLKKARFAAKMRNLNIKLICADLQSWFWPENYFDGVIAIFVHFQPDLRTRVHRSMLRSLKSGGILIMQAFHVDQIRYGTGGPKAVEMLYTASLLRTDFTNASFLDLRETIQQLKEGEFHDGPAAIINLTLQKHG
jgi:ubiquinone/menaquinone biosynthesis C-methylase UbiE